MNMPTDDIDKFNFYLSASFCFQDSLLFSSVVIKPSNAELSRLKTTLKKIEIERSYNHFHMSAITEDVDRQREFAIELWKKWRNFFNEKIPHKQLTIEICDLGLEVIVYVYQNE